MQDQDFTPPPAPTGAIPVAPLGPTAATTLGDMRFMGWVTLIYGVLTCLTIVGAVLGVPVIIASHRFIEGVNRLEVFRQSGAEADLAGGFAEMGRSFRILKIVTVIYLVLTALYLVFLFMMGGLGLLAELADA